MSPLRTGFLAFVEHTGVDGTRSAGLDEGIRLFRRAEQLGYDAGWVRTRHLEPYLSAPLPFFAALAQQPVSERSERTIGPVRPRSGSRSAPPSYPSGTRTPCGWPRRRPPPTCSRAGASTWG